MCTLQLLEVLQAVAFQPRVLPSKGLAAESLQKMRNTQVATLIDHFGSVWFWLVLNKIVTNLRARIKVPVKVCEVGICTCTLGRWRTPIELPLIHWHWVWRDARKQAQDLMMALVLEKWWNQHHRYWTIYIKPNTPIFPDHDPAIHTVQGKHSIPFLYPATLFSLTPRRPQNAERHSGNPHKAYFRFRFVAW